MDGEPAAEVLQKYYRRVFLKDCFYIGIQFFETLTHSIFCYSVFRTLRLNLHHIKRFPCVFVFISSLKNTVTTCAADFRVFTKLRNFATYVTEGFRNFTKNLRLVEKSLLKILVLVVICDSLTCFLRQVPVPHVFFDLLELRKKGKRNKKTLQ